VPTGDLTVEGDTVGLLSDRDIVSATHLRAVRSG
jgi:hypothetical protein